MRITITKIFTGLLIIFSIGYLLIGSLQKINIYDEGFILYNSFNVFRGQVPYRDFWTLYTPGQYYLLALFFKIFGPYVIVNRIIDFIIRFTIGIFVFRLSFLLSSSKRAIFSYLICIYMLGSIGFFGYPVIPAFMLSLINLFLLFNFINKKNNKLIFSCGIITGLATFFKHEVGLYLLITSIIFLLIYPLFNSKNRVNTSDSQKLLIFNKEKAIFLLGYFVIFIPALVYFLNVVDVKVLWSDLIGYNINSHNSFRALPYPLLIPNFANLLKNYKLIVPYLIDWIGFYYPLLIYSSSLFFLYHQYKLNAINDNKKTLKILILIIFGLLLFISSLTRADSIHYLPSTIIAIIVTMSVSELYVKKINISLLLVLITVINVFVNTDSISWLTTAQIAYNNIFTIKRTVNVKRSIFIPIEHDQLLAIKYIDKKTPQGAYVYVGLPRHDKVYINDISFYFLANRNSPSMYYELDPGLITTARIQNNIVSSLITKKVMYVVIFSKFINHTEQNMSSKSSGVKILDEYIKTNYSTEISYGNYTIMKKTIK